MKEKERPTVTLKLKPYLKEFLLCELRTNLASKRNIIGILLEPFLEPRPEDIDPSFPEGPEYITISLPYSKHHNIRGNLWISPENQQHFERFVEWHFKQLFFQYMNEKIKIGFTFKLAILSFCKDHAFTYCYINYEMLKKDYYRKRKKIEKNMPPYVSDYGLLVNGIFSQLN